MKVNILDAHDRYKHFTKQEFSIGDCCQELINSRPFGDHPFYIFAHPRTEEREPGVRRLIWQPRLTKPKPQTNSLLFKGYPGTDNVKVIWIIPAREMWDEYQFGKLAACKIVAESIHDFQYDRAKLEKSEEDDLSDEAINAIYREIAASVHNRRTDKNIL